MIVAVFDCNVVMAALGWRSEAYHCMVAVAKRRAQPVVTDWILEEYTGTVEGMESEKIFPRNPWPMLNWFIAMCRAVEPVSVGKRRSRDASDDPYIECALGAKAEFIISRDPDLLALEKPFGIQIVTPRQFLNHLASVEDTE